MSQNTPLEIFQHWSILTGIVGSIGALIIYFRERKAGAALRTSVTMDKLMEDDKLIIEHPEIQNYLSLNAKQTVAYFRNEERLKENDFYKAKTFAYKQINLFDEILAIDKMMSGMSSFFNRPYYLTEMPVWKKFMKVKLRHPLYQSILIYEKDVLGKPLQDFWEENQRRIKILPIDPLNW